MLPAIIAVTVQVPMVDALSAPLVTAHEVAEPSAINHETEPFVVPPLVVNVSGVP